MTIERYGFDPNEKLLIVRADDVGMCHLVNKAIFEAFYKGVLSSYSLMIPCPWIMEAVDFFKENSHYDYGIHSTLTSEWEFYRWGTYGFRGTRSYALRQTRVFVEKRR